MNNYKREQPDVPGYAQDVSVQRGERVLEQIVAAVLDAVEVPLFVHDTAYRIVRANEAYAREAGRAADTLIGEPYYTVFPVSDGPLSCCRAAVEQGGRGRGRELLLPDGRRFVARSYPLADERGEAVYGLHLLFPADPDSVELPAPEAIRVPDANPNPILRISGDGRLMFGNSAGAAFCEQQGMREGESVPEPWLEAVRDAIENGRSRFLELEAEGRSIGFSLAPAPAAGHVDAYGVDVTEWRKTESRLRHRVALEALVTSIAADCINAGAGELARPIERALEQAGKFAVTDRCSVFELSLDGSLISSTHEWCIGEVETQRDRLQELPASLLYSWLEHLEGTELVELSSRAELPVEFAGVEMLLLPDRGAFIAAPLRLEGEMLGFILLESRADGREWRNEDAYLLKLLSQILAGALGRQRSDCEMRIVNRALRTLTACNESLVHAADEQTLLQQICDHIVDKGGYRFVWVGFLQQDTDQTVVPAAYAGYEAGYLELVNIRLADDRRGRGPVGQAIRGGSPVIVRDTDEDPCFNPWRDEARRRGYRSAIALPLGGEDGNWIGALTIYATSPHAFDTEEVKLLGDLACDLSFGVHSLRGRAARRKAELMLQLRDRAIEASRNAVLIAEATSEGLPLIYVNRAFEEITGFSAQEVLGRSPSFLYGPDPEQSGLRELARAVKNRQEAAVLLRNYRKDGSLFWNDLRTAPVRNEQGEVTHFVGIINDVTERQRYQEQLEHRAHHDDLTGLPNRTLMYDRLQQALIYGERHARTAAVLFLDIDNFKIINDSLGHRIGDKLLTSVGARLRESARRGDTVARYGGDEYVVILGDLEREEDVSQASDLIRRQMLRPFDVGGHQLAVTFSIGASLYPQDGREPDTLIRNADTAMYRAKEVGRNTVQFYTEGLNARLLERLNLESQFRRALEQNRLLLHFQPQLELASWRVTGMEALLRWDHPELGLVPPERFIPVAEDTGLIVPVGRWVLHTACSYAAQWQQAGLPPVTVAVNVSARQLQERDFVRQVEEVLRTTGLAPYYLELELTESAVMSDPELMARQLQELKDLGCQIALDDFGTGYSSFSHIKRFYFDRLKIDKSFVRDITTNPDDAAIAQTIITMARGLRLRVIAEGVESEGQLQHLRQQGCDEVQGYHISPPLPAGDAARLLGEQAVRPGTGMLRHTDTAGTP